MSDNQLNNHIRSTEMKLFRMETKLGAVLESMERMEEMFEDVVATRTHVARLRDDVETLYEKKASRNDVYRISGIVFAGVAGLFSTVMTMLK